MTPAQRLAGARAHLDKPPTPTVPGQTAIPLAALAIIRGTLTDHPRDHPETQTAHIHDELTRNGWTITPAQENP